MAKYLWRFRSWIYTFHMGNIRFWICGCRDRFRWRRCNRTSWSRVKWSGYLALKIDSLNNWSGKIIRWGIYGEEVLVFVKIDLATIISRKLWNSNWGRNSKSWRIWFLDSETKWSGKYNLGKRSLGGSSSESPKFYFTNLDGGCIVTGESSPIDGDVTGNHDGDAGCLGGQNTDSSGVIQWQKSYGGSGGESGWKHSENKWWRMWVWQELLQWMEK